MIRPTPVVQWRIGRLTAICVLACTAASGCQSSGGSRPSSAQDTGSASAQSGASALSPLPLLPVLQREAAFESAFGRLLASSTRACMKSLGFDYRIDLPEAVPDVRTYEDVLASRYGAPRPGQDGVLGYPTTEPTEPTPDIPPASAAYVRALAGTRIESVNLAGVDGETWAELRFDDGCGGSSLAGVFGSVDDLIEFSRLRAVVDSASSNSLDRISADLDELDEVQLWRTCMRSEGFEAETPFDAQYLASTALPKDKEGVIAAVDVACRERSGLHGALASAEGAFQDEAMAAHPDVVDDLVVIYDDVIGRAQASTD